MSPASSSRLSGAFNVYRLCTLFAVGVLAAAECKVTAWNIYVFWNAMATVVVSVAALAAYMTRRPTTGPVWLELAASAVFGALWTFSMTLHVHTTALCIARVVIGCLALYGLVLAIAAICFLWLKKNTWTRPVHAMSSGPIVLPEDPDANAVSTQAPANAVYQSNAINKYRLFTLFAIAVLAATECKMTPWAKFMFWVPMSTEVVSVAALTAYITQRPTSGPVWLELAVSTTLSALWMVSGILRILKYSYYIRGGIVNLIAFTFLTLYSLVLAIAAIRLAWRKESSWTRPVHAMGNGRIVLEE